MNTKILLKIGLFVVSIAGFAAANASTFVAMTAEELIQEADAVVQGRVVHLQSRWDAEGRIIVTEATVQVSETIVGTSAAQIVVQTPGGKVADFRVDAIGFPQLAKGEEVILFLKAGQSTLMSRIVGHQQGHFEVVTRLDGVTLAVPRVEEGVSFLTRSGRSLPPPRSTELKAFKGRVRAEAVRIGKQVSIANRGQ